MTRFMVGVILGSLLTGGIVLAQQDWVGMTSDGTSLQFYNDGAGNLQWMDSTGQSGQIYRDPSLPYPPGRPC